MAVRVVSRRLVKASDSSIKPHVVTFSNLDLINDVQFSMTCVYPKPPTGEFDGVVAAFEAHLPSFLNYFFPMAGRIVFNPRPGLPELHCSNQGAELVVGHIVVELRALNWRVTRESTKKMQIPYDEEVALSVQLISFACGGFAVVWATHHLIGDGGYGMMLVRMWSELVRTGSISGGAPTHDRSVFFRPRDSPSYGSSVAGMFAQWDHERTVNALMVEESFVERLYYVEESDIARLRVMAAGAADGQRATRVQAVSAYIWKVLAGVVGASPLLTDANKRCRLAWYVDGRSRLSPPELRAALQNYAGNVRSYVLGDAAVDTVLSRPLADVAAMVREAITGRDYDQHYQDLVDWVEVHKAAKFVETSGAGLGSPTVTQTIMPSFSEDTDFGFGQASLVMPVVPNLGRFCSSLLSISVRSADSGGAWIINAYMWPRLAAALESDEQHVFKPLTAEYLLATARPRL